MTKPAAFRPSVDLPDAPASLRTAAKALARRLAAVGCGSEGTTLRGTDKCWTMARAGLAAVEALPYPCADASLVDDLLALVSGARAAGHKADDAARAATVMA